MAYLIVAALVFGACYLIDRFFTKTFRGQAQHKTGLSVRYSKRYALFGLILVILAILGIMTGAGQSKVLFWGGFVVLAMGAGLIAGMGYLAFAVLFAAVMSAVFLLYHLLKEP